MVKPALLVAMCTALLGSTVAIAASLSISPGRLGTFTHTYGTPVTCSLEASADSFVKSDAGSATTNHGTLTTLVVRAHTASTARALVRFDLSSCSPAIPAGAIVHSAALRLTLATEATTTRTYDVNRVTASWVETMVTWNTQPSVAASASSSATISSGTVPSTVVEWSVVGDVQDIVSGAAANDGWRVNDSVEDSDVELKFHSREAASSRPQLVITYVE